MPSTRGTNAPRRSKRVPEVEKQQAKLKAQQAAKLAKQQAAAAKKKLAAAAAKKPKAEDKKESVVADVKKKAGKAVKEVKNKVVKPAAKKVAKAAGVKAEPTKAKAKAAPTKKKATTTTTVPKKKTTSSTTKAVSAPKAKAAAPKKRGPPKARDAAAPAADKKPAASKKAADKPKKEETTVAHYKVGDIVEDVTLQDEDDKPVSVKSLYENKHLVIFSYPKADTPGCTTQACGYRDSRSEYEEHGATVIGLSCDKPSAQLKWKSKNELGYSLLSDPNADLLLKKLGWSDKAKRSHWVIQKGGKLAEAKLGVKPADDPKNALEFVKSLKDSSE